jgi:WD40 repeat protein
MDVDFCCDGRRLVSSSRDSSIRIWYADTGEVIKSLYFGMSNLRDEPSFSSGKQRLALPADGTKLGSSRMRQIVKPDTVGCQTKPAFAFAGDTVALSPDSSQIASTTGTGLVLIWESSTGQVQQIHDDDSPPA